MINIAINAATSAKKILIENFGKINSEDIKEKKSNDFLTFVDEQAEKTIIEILHDAFPDHSILAEESGWKKQNSEFEWIIDPLDGTKNYISGIPFFSISIALRHSNKIQIGIVLDPTRDELFTAVRDKGAFLNGKRIHISNRKNLEESLLATGFPFKQKESLPLYVKCFQDIFKQSSGMRRMGSAAIDLAYVAVGRFEGFWELGLSPWDMASGSLIIEEAGGRVTDFWGNDSYLTNGYITATNGHIHQNLLQIIQRHFSQIKPSAVKNDFFATERKK
jgi:myo-inositol-1(or 4)-monophosphatase